MAADEISADLADVDQRIQQLQGKMLILQRQLHSQKGHSAQGCGPAGVGLCREMSPPQAPLPAGTGGHTRTTSKGAGAAGGGTGGAPEGGTGNGRWAFASQS